MTVRWNEQRKAWMVDVQVELPDGSLSERVRKTVPIQTKAGATSYEAQVRTALLNGTWKKKVEVVASKPTISAVLEDFLSWAGIKSGKDEVQRKRRVLERVYIPLFRDTPLDKIEAKAINADTAKRRPTLSGKTLQNQISVLLTLLRWAETEGHVPHVPRVSWPSTAEQAYDFLSPEETALYIEAANEEPMWGLAVLVAITLGLRRGELRALHWEQLDLKSKKITVDRAYDQEDRLLPYPKSKRVRVLDLPDQIVEAIRQHPRRVGSPFVFASEDGDGHTDNEMKHPLYRASKRAAALAAERKIETAKPIERVNGWHVFRHTFCSRLVALGVHLAVVQRLAGHTNIKTTLRYAHVADDQGLDAMRKLGAAVGG